jgi:hypothetical protein
VRIAAAASHIPSPPFPAGVSVPVAFTHDQDVRPAALITGNPHQAVEPVAAAGTVEAVLSADQAAMFIVEEGEIDLGHAAAPELSSALARPAMPWRWGTLPSVPSRSLGERLALRLVWRGLVLVTAAGVGVAAVDADGLPDHVGLIEGGDLVAAAARAVAPAPLPLHRQPAAGPGAARASGWQRQEALGASLPRPAGCRAERTARKPGHICLPRFG